MNYFLRSERLGLRRWTHADLELALRLWGDSEVTRLIGGPFSPEQVHARLACELENALQYWPMFLLLNGAFVGCCGLRPYRPAERIHRPRGP